MQSNRYKFKPLLIWAIQVFDTSEKTVNDLNEWVRSLGFPKEDEEFALCSGLCSQIFLFGKEHKERGVFNNDYVVVLPELKIVNIYSKEDFENLFDEASVF